MRYGLVSDIHSNLAALEAALRAIEKDGPIDGILCMGDIIGYGPQPNEVITRLKEYNLFTIIGNHDLAVLNQLDLADFNRDAIDANVWTRFQLLPNNFDWLETLKPYDQFDDKVTLAHGSPAEPVWEYLTNAHNALRSFDIFETQLCFVGHTHLPRYFLLKETELSRLRLPLGLSEFREPELYIPEPGDVIELDENRAIINPGSVGQPRDGDKRAAFAIYDDARMTVKFGRVNYDISLTQELMRQAMLPARLVMRLDYGL